MNIKNIFLTLLIILFFTEVSATKPTSLGKFKDWQSFTVQTEQGKICFAQSIPKKRTSKNFKRENSKMIVTFRLSEKIKNEVSVTSGHIYKIGSVAAKSGRNDFSFFSQNDFAWIADNKEEEKFIKLMKKATNIMVSAKEPKGSQTVDHYSMMGFTKAYNTAKKNCA